MRVAQMKLRHDPKREPRPFCCCGLFQVPPHPYHKGMCPRPDCLCEKYQSYAEFDSLHRQHVRQLEAMR